MYYELKGTVYKLYVGGSLEICNIDLVNCLRARMVTMLSCQADIPGSIPGEIFVEFGYSLWLSAYVHGTRVALVRCYEFMRTKLNWSRLRQELTLSLISGIFIL